MEVFEKLPEGCIAAILSHTTPIDVGRLSLLPPIPTLSGIIFSLPIPNSSTLSSLTQYPSLATAPTKKALYLALPDHPLLISLILWLIIELIVVQKAIYF